MQCLAVDNPVTGCQSVLHSWQRSGCNTTVDERSVRDGTVAAMDAGVTNHIVKPFAPLVLKEKTHALLPAAA